MQIKQVLDHEWALYKDGIFQVFLQTSPYQDRVKEEQQYYFKYWVEEYYQRYPDYFWIAVDEKQKVIGYVAICPDSKEALNWIPWQSYPLFLDYFDSCPGHLHINVLPKSHGQGVGKKLLDQALKSFSYPLHIITEASQSNVNFYLKNSFIAQAERPFKGRSLLLMSRDAAV